MKLLNHKKSAFIRESSAVNPRLSLPCRPASPRGEQAGAKPSQFFTKKKTIGLGLLIAIIVLAASYFIFYRQTQESQAAEWYNENWHYRQQFDVYNNSSTEDLLDFQVPISTSTLNLATLFSAGKLKVDFTDLRFTDKNGNLLDYWFPDATSTMDTVYIKFPTLTKAATTTVMMYYGNPSASDTRNGKNVFPDFFEDFADGNYTTGPKNWSVTSGAYSVAGTDKYLTPSADGVISTPSTKFNGTWEGSIYHGNGNNLNMVFIDARPTPVGLVASGYYINFGVNQNITLFRIDEGSQTALFQTADSYFLNDVWYRFKVIRSPAGVFTLYIKGGAFGSSSWTEVVETSGNNPTNPDNNYNASLRFAHTSEVADRLDNILWRQFAVTDPTVTTTAGTAEEIGGGPVGYWKFDEGYGTTAQDFSSYGNDGTLTNMSTSGTSTAWVEGKVGKALMFDGTDDYVDAGTGVTDSMENAGSISMWVKPVILGGIFSRSTGTGWNDERLVLHFYDANSKPDLTFASGAAYDQYNNSASPLKLNEWTLMTVTYNGSTVKHYFNGRLDKSQAQTVTPELTNVATWIGRVQGLTPAYYKGIIDEVKLFNYALSASQIQAEYNRSKSVVFGADNGSKTQGLVGYWKMDESTTTWDGANDTVFDSSGSGNNGTSAGDAKASTTAQYGNAGDFDGTGDYVDVGNISTLDAAATNFSVSVWFKTTHNANVHTTMVAKGGNIDGQTSQPGWMIIKIRNGLAGYENKLMFILQGINSRVAMVSNSAVNDGAWHMAALTIDSFSKVRFYLDGANQGQTYGTGQDASVIGSLANARSFGIARHDQAANGGNSPVPNWNGQIDDVKIYNLARTPDQIMQDYLQGPGPIAYYNFEEGSGTSLNDISGNGNNPSISGLSTTDWVPGKYGTAADFDGSGDYLTLNPQNLFNPTMGTISLWVKPRTLCGADVRYYFYHYNGGHRIYLRSEASCNGSGTMGIGNNSVSIPAGTFQVGVWQHFLMIYTSNTGYLYKNGILIVSQAYNVPLSFDSTFSISSSGSSATDGFIDEVKIWNYALTPWQIAQEYNNGKPIAQWSFDEGQGTTAYNSQATSTGALAGTLTNMSVSGTSTAWTSGKMGKALMFDGVDDYVNCGTGFNTSTVGNNFSLSAWIKPTGNGKGSGADIIQQETGSGAPYASWGISLYDDNRLAFWTGATDNSYEDSFRTVRPISLNNWYHVVMTYNGNSKKIYLNGVLDNSENYTKTIKYVAGQICGMGIWTYSISTNVFKGLIDEPKIFNYALSPAQIRQDYNDGLAASLSSLDGGQNIQNGLAGYWKMDESTTSWDGAGDIVFDSSGVGNNGTSTGDAKASTTSKYGNAGDFDGNGDYVEVAYNSALAPTKVITASAWFNTRDKTANQRVISKTQSGGYQISLNENSVCGASMLCFVININSSYYAATYALSNLSNNTWYFVSGVYDGKNIKLYLNGNEVARNTSASGLITYSVNNAFCIGAEPEALTCSDTVYFNGLIDDVKIYNIARTPDQIMQDYLQGPGPMAYYNFEEGTGATANDTSGQGHSGTITAGASRGFVNGKIGTAYDFDGLNTKIDAGSDWIGAQAVTISVWIYADSHGENLNGRIIDNSKTMLHLNGTGSGYVKFTSNGSTYAYSASNLGYIGGWYHVVATRTATGTANIYINGVLSGTANQNSGLPTLPTVGTNVIIGNRNDQALTFDGRIDEVKVYNYVLTPWQIAQEYNSGKPIGYWKMDEGEGSTIRDYSGNGNNGTLVLAGSPATSSAWQASSNCKLNGCLSFDGTNDYVTMGLVAKAPTGNSDRTLSVWLKQSGAGSGDMKPALWLGSSNTHNITALGIRTASNCLGMTFWADELDSTVQAINSTWFHLVGTYNGSTREAKLYINGVFAVGKTLASDLASPANVYIGNDGGLGRNINGLIDEAKIYNYVLSPAQIKNDYNMGKGIFFK